jgi:hypothetical protein
VHEQAAIEDMEDAVKDPYLANLIDRTMLLLRDGTWSADYLAPLGQPGRGWRREQVWAFCRLHAMTRAGSLSRFRIPVGATPGRDANRVGNAAKLAAVSDGHGGYVVDLHPTQHHADYDGVFRWAEPIQLVCPGRSRLRVDPWWAPLEVGTCYPSRVALHLFQFGAVARWPYGQDAITVLLRVPTRGEGVDVTNLPVVRETPEDEEADYLEAEVATVVHELRERGLRTSALFIERAMTVWKDESEPAA